MPFSDAVIQAAFHHSGGRCQCARSSHDHQGRCARTIQFADRGREEEHGWQAVHRQPVAIGGSDTLDNCEILCVPCQRQRSGSQTGPR